MLRNNTSARKKGKNNYESERKKQRKLKKQVR